MVDVKRYVDITSAVSDSGGGGAVDDGGGVKPDPTDPNKILITVGMRTGVSDGMDLRFDGFATEAYLAFSVAPLQGPQIGTLDEVPERVSLLTAGVASQTNQTTGLPFIQTLTVLIDSEDEYASATISLNGEPYDLDFAQIGEIPGLGENLQFAQLYDLEPGPVPMWPLPVGQVSIELRPLIR